MLYCFVGPSHSGVPPPGHAGEVVMLPPIGFGDLAALPIEAGDVVAMVDGVFFTQPAVRHKEILGLLDRGVRIVGGASMGALRAVELQPWGMIGVGRVVEMYASAEIDGDDEVALLHTDDGDGYRSLSVALVSLRESCRDRTATGALLPGEASDLVGAMAGLHFMDRTIDRLRRVAAEIGLAPEAIQELVLDLDGSRPDVKHRDAELVVRRGLELAAEDPRRRQGAPATSHCRTQSVLQWERSLLERRRDRAGPLLFLACQLVNDRFEDFYREFALAEMTRAWGLPPGASQGDVIAAFRARVGVAGVPPAGFHEWLAADGAGWDGGDGWDEGSLVRLAVASYREAPGVVPVAAAQDALLDGRADLRALGEQLSAAYGEARRPDQPWTQMEYVASADVASALDWVRELWGVRPDRAAVRRAGLARGFADIDEIVDSAHRLGFLRRDPALLGAVQMVDPMPG